MQLKSKYKSGYRKKKNIRKYLFIIISVVLFSGVLGSGAYLIYYMNHIDSVSSHANEKSITIYQAAEPIQHGQIITATMLVEIEANAACEEAYYSSLDCIGLVAIVDIPQGMTIMQNMCRLPDVESGDREVECEIITLSDNLIENDCVDVRLMLPNGEDYIVLAKKGVHDLYTSEDGQEEVCYLWLSEEEILYYSAAVVDAYLYQGASLYTTKYIEPTIQQASLVTYVPSLGTITMMKENPNLFDLALSKLKLEERKLLENRLTDYLNLDIRERNWNVSSKEQSEEGNNASDDTTNKDQANQTDSVDESKLEHGDKEEETEIETKVGQEDKTEVNTKLGQEDKTEVETKVGQEDKVEASAFVED